VNRVKCLLLPDISGTICLAWLVAIKYVRRLVNPSCTFREIGQLLHSSQYHSWRSPSSSNSVIVNQSRLLRISHSLRYNPDCNLRLKRPSTDNDAIRTIPRRYNTTVISSIAVAKIRRSIVSNEESDRCEGARHQP